MLIIKKSHARLQPWKELPTQFSMPESLRSFVFLYPSPSNSCLLLVTSWTYSSEGGEVNLLKEELLPLLVISVILLALRVSLVLASDVWQLAELDRNLEFAFSLVGAGGRGIAGIGEFDFHVVEGGHGLLVFHGGVLHLLVLILVGLIVGGGLALALALVPSLVLALTLGGGSDGLDLVVLGQGPLDQLVECIRAPLDGSVVCRVVSIATQEKATRVKPNLLGSSSNQVIRPYCFNSALPPPIKLL